jgi:hypothetical protein
MLANASISYSSSRFADIIGACLMVLSHVAHAAPPPDADMQLAPWFHSLTIPNTGSSCCGAADCRNYPVMVASDGYRVQFKGQWLKVPPGVVQDRGDNPTGITWRASSTPLNRRCCASSKRRGRSWERSHELSAFQVQAEPGNSLSDTTPAV